MLEGSQLYLSHWKKEWWEFSNEIPQLQEAFDKMFVVDEGCIAAKCVKIIFSFLGP